MKTFTAADVRRFYDKFYTPSNMILFCVGNFDTEESQKLVEGVFAQEKARELPAVVRSHLLEEEHEFETIDPKRKFSVFTHNLLSQVRKCP